MTYNIDGLPIQHGFKFIGLRQSGIETVCYVVHHVRSDSYYILADDVEDYLTGWRYV